jgi:hypothetical protein
MKTAVWRVLAAVLAGMSAWAGVARGGNEGWLRGQAKLAKEAYDKGDAAEALEQWEPLEEAGVTDPQLWYDMGNALYRLGRYPEAIRMYRRAQRELPRDPDVEYNLGLAAQAAGVALPERGRVEAWLGEFSAREWTWAAEAGFWALVALGGVALGWPRARGRLGAPAVVAAGLLVVGVAGAAWPRWAERHPECVVMGEKAQVLRSAPLDTAAEVAEARPGTLVRRVAESGFWAEVTAGEAQGWIPAGALAKVVKE